jgi:DNA processing protein
VVGSHAAKALRILPPSWTRSLPPRWRGCRTDDVARHVITLGDPLYPTTLLEAPDPPLLLYAEGRLDLLQAASIAIVGSRNPTAQGADNARAFAATLAEAGLTIVSGLALGSTARPTRRAAAHPRRSPWSAPGSTRLPAAPLDLGAPHRPPRADAERIPARHAVRPPNFPQRNRIIAGLSLGTLVVGRRRFQSGSLITARLALDAGRDVFAIPGSIHSPQARGCHHLIKQGAKLVDSAQDVLDELGWPADADTVSAAASLRLRPRPRARCAGLRPGVRSIRWWPRIGWPSHDVTRALLQLELEGTSPACRDSVSSACAGLKAAGRASEVADESVVFDGRGARLGYSGFMFDVLVYLYENYWRPDACPDHAQ